MLVLILGGCLVSGFLGFAGFVGFAMTEVVVVVGCVGGAVGLGFAAFVGAFYWCFDVWLALRALFGLVVSFVLWIMLSCAFQVCFVAVFGFGGFAAGLLVGCR